MIHQSRNEGEKLGRRGEKMEARIESKELLELERSKPSFLESNFLVCKKEGEDGGAARTKNRKNKTWEDGEGRDERERRTTAVVPTSQVLDKVKDFLGVIADANEKLQLSVQGSGCSDYDIEVLSGNQSEYIEMDLLLGVAELQTSEAVAAAEAAIGGSHQSLSSFDKIISSDSEESSDEENDYVTEEASISHRKDTNDPSSTSQSRKRPKITVLN